MTKQIPLSGKYGTGKFALVDDADYEFLMQWEWYMDSWGYVARTIRLPNKKCKKLFMHRIVNNTPDGLETDHINRNTIDNQKHNLRSVTSSQNKCNKPAKINTSSKHKGVAWDKRDKKWRAYIRIEKSQKYLGHFKNEIDAAMAYNQSAIKIHGEFACLNKI